MVVRFGENSTCSRPVQPANALSPIHVMLSGIETLFRLVHSINACILMPVTGYPPSVAGISTVPPAPLYFLMIALPLLAPYSKSLSGAGVANAAAGSRVNSMATARNALRTRSLGGVRVVCSFILHASFWCRKIQRKKPCGLILLYHRACKIPINLWLVFCAKKGSQLGALVSHSPANFQLGVQLVDVLLDRSLREVECFGDLLVGAALGLPSR